MREWIPWAMMALSTIMWALGRRTTSVEDGIFFLTCQLWNVGALIVLALRRR